MSEHATRIVHTFYDKDLDLVVEWTPIFSSISYKPKDFRVGWEDKIGPYIQFLKEIEKKIKETRNEEKDKENRGYR